MNPITVLLSAALVASWASAAWGQASASLPEPDRLRTLPRQSRPALDSLLLSLERAYETMNVEAFVSHFTDDFEQVDVGRRVHIEGKDAWRRQTRNVNSTHRAMRRRHFGRVESGRRVIVEVEWSGTAIGDVIGKGEGDREYRYSGLVLMEIERGKIRRQIIYSDVGTLREQLGPALTAPSAPGSAPLRAPGRLVDVGGYRLHIHCVGHRSPTLIIDGGVAVWSIFYHGLQEALAPETRVCTYDRAGMGWSDRGPQPRTARRIVAELARLLTNAGETGSVLVAGHSFGGLIARMFAREYPERTAGVVLVESGHPAQWRRLPRQAWDLVVEGQMLYRQAAAAAREGTLGAADVPAAPFRDSPAIRATYVAAMLTPTPYEGTADELDAMAESFEQFSALGDLGATPLAVVTARSSFAAFAGTPIPVDSANAAWWEMQTELTRLSSNVRHFVSILGDHNVVWTDLTTTVAAIRDLLARVRSLPQ